MTTVSSSFTATGSSTAIAISGGESVAIVLSGTWVGTVLLQRRIGGYAWETVAAFTANVTQSITAPTGGGIFRWKCTAYTSGTIVYSLTDNVLNVVVGLGTVARATETTFQIDTADINGGAIDATVIGAAVVAAASFSTVSATGAITSTLATGSAPLVVASTTVVANLNASALSGATMAAPGAIGGGTPAAVTGTTVTGAAIVSTQTRSETGIEDTLTAHAGGTQGAALALSATKSVHHITVCATNGDSVSLPVLAVGQIHTVINSGAATCQVYGAGTSTINDVATATGVTLTNGKAAQFIAVATGKWYSVALA